MPRGKEEYNWIDGVESLENYRPAAIILLQLATYYMGTTIDTHQEQYVAVKFSITDVLLREN
ncbi:uncharacterized protein ACLA_051970 [Aspergillus clavatus NRRL 1]|uniref:Uncharacterized protein n=1 Tax=Aspergillus clavatus (strain ATCC 1007 / CBS 513.65 / DSM 816 / NCTC 3887 / NRRL 1 / QM 1276 / 107) TaxID=344612 RepID=A1CIM0_ASPCL|nr:uncharacterized protein ACLA_051970 [Aspergillus clavatus NRRL 1]EAW10725.1 hypothetical protein ACLA_051970 [Aspergillus clavatus NRRL 1]